MLRIILIIGLLVGVANADIQLKRLYKAIPTIANSEDVSPRTKHRFTIHFRAIDGFNAIKVSNKYKGNRTLYYYTSKGGYDYYTDKKSHNTIRIDRHSNLYMQYIGDKGRAGDWIELRYTKVKAKRSKKRVKARRVIGTVYTDKYGHKTRVCEEKGSELRVIPYQYGQTDFSRCKLAETEIKRHYLPLYPLGRVGWSSYKLPRGVSGYDGKGTWQFDTPYTTYVFTNSWWIDKSK